MAYNPPPGYPPPGEQPPGQQPPGQQPPGYQQPGQPAAGWPQPGYQQPGQQPPGYQQPGAYQQPGYQPAAYQQPGYQQAAASGMYANWGQRAAAALIDWAPIAVGVVVLFILNAIFQSFILGILLDLVLFAGSIYWWVTNRIMAMGNTGQSLGKRQMGIKLVAEASGQPIGAGQVFLRDIVHTVDSVICYVGWLFPLWDAKAQTLADKIMNTIVVPA